MKNIKKTHQGLEIGGLIIAIKYNYLTIAIILPIIYKMRDTSVSKLYLEDINKLPDVNDGKLNELATEAKSKPNYLTKELMEASLKMVAIISLNICKTFQDRLGDLINNWLSRKLPRYVENFKPDKGNFRYYIQAHMRKDLYNYFLKIVEKDKIQIEKIAYKLGEEEYILKTLEIKEKVNEIKRKWKKLKWNSEINKTIYCTVYSFYPDFRNSNKNLNQFMECYNNPSFFFDELVLTEVTQKNSKLLNDYKRVCEILNRLMEEGFPPDQDKKWTNELLTDRKRNLKNWLQKNLRLK